MIYPRLFAVAENAWTKYENKNWEGFLAHLKPQIDKLDEKGIRNAKSVYRPWVHHEGGNGNMNVWFSSEIPNTEIRYTLDGGIPDANSPLATDKILLNKTTTIQELLKMAS